MSRRKRNTKPTRSSIAIVGEGKTEIIYFRQMNISKKYKFTLKPDFPKHSDLKSIIKKARSMKDEGYDHVFCVFDLDRILTDTTEKRIYESELKKIRLKKNIYFIESHPCFELWFLYHFGRSGLKQYNCCDSLIHDLKTHLPHYSKEESYLKRNNIYKLLIENGNIEAAIDIATEKCSQKALSNNEGLNFTMVHKLIEFLEKK